MSSLRPRAVLLALLAAAGLALIYPGTLTDIIGIAVVAVIMAIEIISKKRAAAA